MSAGSDGTPFGRSPFGPMRRHLEKVVECAQMLQPLFQAVLDGSTEGVQRTADVIDRLEDDADLVKNELRDHLPRSTFLPVDRRDLLELIHTQDSIADMTQEVGGLLTLKSLRLPDELRDDVLDLVGRVCEACATVLTVGTELTRLAETTIEGARAGHILGLIEELDRSETRADVAGRRLVRRLFSLEDHMSPVDVMLWYQIFYTAGHVADAAESVGNHVRLLIARP